MNIYQIRPISPQQQEEFNMNARNHVKTSKIAHAMAYVDTFMMSSDPDECELKFVFEQAHTLSSQEVVAIIKVLARRSQVFGIKTILKEMDLPEFAEYVNRMLELYRARLMED